MLNPELVERRLARARAAADAEPPIRYRLGRGGMDPGDPLPTRDGYCDCSGFAAWILEMSRAPKPARPWWIETTMIVRDALQGGPDRTFVKLARATPGCLVVYPDAGGKQGHVGIVSEAKYVDGKLKTLKGIDCAMGPDRSKRRAITERDFRFFLRCPAIFVTLRQDGAV